MQESVSNLVTLVGVVVGSLNDNAGAIQAVGSVAIAVLTFVLIRVTNHYAQTTANYARTAEQQLKESVLARETTFQPYLHVLSVVLGTDWDPGEASGTGFARVHYMNVGPGVALSLAASLSTPAGTFDRGRNLPDIASPDSKASQLTAMLPEGVFVQDDEVLCGVGLLKIRCRDLLNRSWVTEVPVRIELKLNERNRWAEVTVLDQQEQIYRGELQGTSC